MTITRIDGKHFQEMIRYSALYFHAHVEAINALNVFPVPDGDTGTNMHLTWKAAVEALDKRSSERIGEVGVTIASGLLHGSRGNSGVILSQLFRGFCKSVERLDSISTVDMAAALQFGVEMGYRAIQRPTEGTILTVARESAKYAVNHANQMSDFVEFLQGVVEHAKKTLAQTPDMLPVLKQAGVVDAGGKGLVVIYEGLLRALISPNALPQPDELPTLDKPLDSEQLAAQAHFSTAEIGNGYCTEFMIRLRADLAGGPIFEESAFRERLESFGDSLLVIADERLVKVHIHAEQPGDVLNEAIRYGELERIKIENMRMQHEEIVGTTAPFALIAVASGEGLTSVFRSLGCAEVIAGGQSMNPSTDQFLQAIARNPARTTFLLPNNSNVILAAQQASELASGEVHVIPSKSLQQGIAALIAFSAEATSEMNAQAMEEALSLVQSGQLTRAVRDSEMDGMQVREGDYIGLHGGTICSADADVGESFQRLVDKMLNDDHSLVTVYIGVEATEEATESLKEWFASAYPDLEIDWLDGGQPVYHYLISAE